MDETALNFSKKLKELRTEKGMSQDRIAKEIGYSNGIISEWERGNKLPTANAIIAIAKLFNVTTDFLLGLEDEQGNKIQLQPTKPTPAKIPFRINAARSKDNKFRDTVIYLTQEQYDEIMKICEKESDKLDF